MKILLILNKDKKINKLIIKKIKTQFKNVTIKYDDNDGFFKKNIILIMFYLFYQRKF